jgi:hypothetical protein
MVILDFLHDRAAWERSVACVSSLSSRDEGLLECRIETTVDLGGISHLRFSARSCRYRLRHA